MKEIIEGNKLIAEFLGWELSLKGRKFKKYLPPFGYVKAHPKYLQFNSSWDWLMLAVDKICNISFEEDGNSEDYYCVLNAIPDINGTYKAVVEFIVGYNKIEK